MGKVHGSLARAGKVRSATPKVGFSLISLCFRCWLGSSVKKEMAQMGGGLSSISLWDSFSKDGLSVMEKRLQF